MIAARALAGNMTMKKMPAAAKRGHGASQQPP
jgi:hypothetical protein